MKGNRRYAHEGLKEAHNLSRIIFFTMVCNGHDLREIQKDFLYLAFITRLSDSAQMKRH